MLHLFIAWVRRGAAELRERERHYPGKVEPDVLDIIAIGMTVPRPHGHQRENHVIDKRRRWVKVSTVPCGRLEAAVDHTLSRQRTSVHAMFTLDGCEYRLKVTDPPVESEMGAIDGDLVVWDAYVCVSLGEPFQAKPDQPRFAYKLVAAVIRPERERAA